MSLLQSIPDFGSPGQWVPRLTLCLLQNCFAISVTLNNFLHLSLRSSRDLGSCGLTPFCLNVLKMLCSCEVLCGTSRVAGQGLPWALTVPCVLAKEHPAMAIMCHSPCRGTTCSPIFMQSRLLLHFPTANTNGNWSACAPACNCGGMPRARMALRGMRSLADVRDGHAAAHGFFHCVLYLLFFSVWLQTLLGSLQGPCPYSETPRAGGYDHPRDSAKSRENTVKAEKFCGSRNPLFLPSSPRKTWQEKSKVEHDQCAKACRCPPAPASARSPRTWLSTPAQDPAPSPWQSWSICCSSLPG